MPVTVLDPSGAGWRGSASSVPSRAAVATPAPAAAAEPRWELSMLADKVEEYDSDFVRHALAGAGDTITFLGPANPDTFDKTANSGLFLPPGK